MRNKSNVLVIICSCLIFIIASMCVNTYHMGKQIDNLQKYNSDKMKEVVSLRNQLDTALDIIDDYKCNEEEKNVSNDVNNNNNRSLSTDEPIIVVDDENSDNSLALANLEKTNKFEEQMDELYNDEFLQEDNYE